LPVVLERPHPPAAVVGEEISALESGIFWPAVNVPAGDGGADRAVVVVDGGDVAGGWIASHAAAGRCDLPFAQPPSVIQAAGAVARLIVDLFAGALSDVADVHVAGHAIEAGAPRVSQA